MGTPPPAPLPGPRPASGTVDQGAADAVEWLEDLDDPDDPAEGTMEEMLGGELQALAPTPAGNAINELPANRQYGNSSDAAVEGASNVATAQDAGKGPTDGTVTLPSPGLPEVRAAQLPEESIENRAQSGELDWQERRKISVRWPEEFVDQMAAAAKRIRRRRPDGRNVSLEQAIYLYAMAGRIDELERGDQSTFARLQAEFLRRAAQPVPRNTRRDDFIQIAAPPQQSTTPPPGSAAPPHSDELSSRQYDPDHAKEPDEGDGLPANRQIGNTANRIAYLPKSRIAGSLIDIESSIQDESILEGDDSISIKSSPFAGNSAIDQKASNADMGANAVRTNPVDTTNTNGKAVETADAEAAIPDPDLDSAVTVITRYIESWQGELGDQEIAPGASAQRAYRLFEESGLDLHSYLEAMRTARDIVRNKGAEAIRYRQRGADGQPTDKLNRTPYFFAVLADICGLRRP